MLKAVEYGDRRDWNNRAIEEYVKRLCSAYPCSYGSFIEVLQMEIVRANESNPYHFSGIHQSRVEPISVFEKARFLDNLKDQRVCPRCQSKLELTLGCGDDYFATARCTNHDCHFRARKWRFRQE